MSVACCASLMVLVARTNDTAGDIQCSLWKMDWMSIVMSQTCVIRRRVTHLVVS